MKKLIEKLKEWWEERQWRREQQELWERGLDIANEEVDRILDEQANEKGE